MIWDAENCELINTTVIESKGKELLPSLTEIKDERIRKWLIRLIETAGYRELETDPMPYKRMDVIAWLKKQKAADCITYAIGEKEVAMATMDDNHKRMKVVILCGSTRFKEQFLEAQKRLTLEGCIVISVGLFGHSGDEEVWEPGTKEMLDEMHLRKIDMADEIFVINVGGYIGESTRREIAYAERAGKKINYLEE